MKLLKNLLLLFLFTATACSKDTPDTVVTNFQDALEKMDLERAKSYISKDAIPIFDMLIKMADENGSEDIEAGQDITFTIKSVDINDAEDIAAVISQMIDNSGGVVDETTFSLVKEEGKWKIIF
ncbi:MAG: DUF4878 domain-containing protein [Prevotellaceae bacterium]|jgi:uncharacterized glyoxalase superfamily protein PhnB|nr:DUF4878 domain-containing protein [Prevotellaceae bacterium]